MNIFKNLFIPLAILLAACSSIDSYKPLPFQGNAMTIDYHIIVGATPQQNEKIQRIISASFEEIDWIYNKWNPDSELSLINLHPGGIPIPISEKLEKLLIITDHVVTLTGGRFDPTIEPVQQLWKKYLSNGSTPPPEEINSLKKITGWDKIQLSNGTLTKEQDGVSLDLGGIAKGYGVDRIVENLRNAGFKDIFVEWGGEIRTTGNHPEGRPWHIYISRLENVDPDVAIAHLDLKNQAIATSGDYLQKWTIKKKEHLLTFFHIIDPRTLQPLQKLSNSIASASVVAPTCAFADGLATAAMMFSSVEEAQIWAEQIKNQFPDVSFWIVSEEVPQNTH